MVGTAGSNSQMFKKERCSSITIHIPLRLLSTYELGCCSSYANVYCRGDNNMLKLMEDSVRLISDFRRERKTVGRVVIL